MSVSTDAILFYGYCWNEERRRPWDEPEEAEDADEGHDSEDWETRFARLRGVVCPTDEYPEDDQRAPADNEVRERFNDYWAKKRQLAAESPCTVERHCHCDAPMPFVTIRASQVTSSRGDVTEVKSLAVDPAWDAQLRTFVTEMQISLEGAKGPAWFLVSDSDY